MVIFALSPVAGHGAARAGLLSPSWHRDGSTCPGPTVPRQCPEGPWCQGRTRDRLVPGKSSRTRQPPERPLPEDRGKETKR
jgi:hypothetical protein